MFPGLGKFDPKKMQGMLKQLGIQQEEIEAERVIIEKADGNIIIKNPSIQKVRMQGQESFQIAGEVHEENKALEITQGDIKLVMEKTGGSEREARKALEEANGDIADAILKLTK